MAMYCHRCGCQFNQNVNRKESFCTRCGTRKKAKVGAIPCTDNEGDVIRFYFHKGYRYESIRIFLMIYHDLSMSVRTIKRRLHQYGLRKRDLSLSHHRVRQIIRNEIKGPSSIRGYRGIWNMLKSTYNLSVPRDSVMQILREEDPIGCASRKSRRLSRRVYNSAGANSCWHADGYDKLKPYGFAIHGCVDGYSRRLIWLKLCRSNNNPVVIASYYLHAVSELGFCPMVVQTDCGTENGILAGIQSFLVNNIKAHRYGSSRSNQRIENWWSHNRRTFTSWVINFFKDLVDSGEVILGSHFHMECLWFIFSKFMQTELDRIKNEWNSHFIRKSRCTVASGIPDELFFLPEIWGMLDCKVPVSRQAINGILNQRDVHYEALRDIDVDDEELIEYFHYVISTERLNYPPADWNEAKETYLKIVEVSGI